MASRGYRMLVMMSPAEPPVLPPPAGPLSELVLALIRSPAGTDGYRELGSLARTTGDLLSAVDDPLTDDDLHLALYLTYGLHYRSFDGVDPAREWEPDTLAIRTLAESTFERSLREVVTLPEPVDPDRVGQTLFELEASDEAPPLASYLERESTLDEFREFVIHRSAYQLKEADPHSWAIPRLTGAPKAALLEVQFDEYGAGEPERMHSRLFATSMAALDLDNREDFYLDRLPGSTLATVNLMSFFGLHRRCLGAIVGHLAMFEMTSSRPNRSHGNGMRRLGFDENATDFFDEHVEADAVHENIAAYDMAGGLAKRSPRLAGDVLFGAACLRHVENTFAASLIESWAGQGTSLRQGEPVVS